MSTRAPLHESSHESVQPNGSKPALRELHLADAAQQTPAEWMRARLRQSPYLVIAASVNLALIAAAAVMQLGAPRVELAPGSIEVGHVVAQEDVKKEEPPITKNIFDPAEPVAELPIGEETIEPSEIIFPDDIVPKASDRDESADNNPARELRGSGIDSPFVASGPNLFDAIGIGGNSGRGGRGGRGTGIGGLENLRRVGRRAVRDPSQVKAADAGLRWLARHQSPDGSWSAEGFAASCQGGTVCDGKGYPEHQVGLSSLALLAFLGAGYDTHSPESWEDPFTRRKIRAGDVVKRSLLWLRSGQTEDGAFVSPSNAKWGYNHSIATLAMAEAAGITRSIPWKESARRAIGALVAGQNAAPGSTGYLGWRYRPLSGDNDISVTGWAVMALKSAQLAGLTVPQSSFEGALTFCDEVTDKTSGRVGYTRREEAGQQVKAIGKNDDYLNHPALEAVGMCVRTFAKHDMNDPMLEAGAKLLVRDLPAWNKAKKANDYYYWYYASLALHQFDGPDSPRAGKGQYWGPWSEALKTALVDHQVKDAKLCSDGSWDADDRWSFEGGRVYATAMNTLTLEVYYRYANVFGRKR